MEGCCIDSGAVVGVVLRAVARIWGGWGGAIASGGVAVGIREGVARGELARRRCV